MSVIISTGAQYGKAEYLEWRAIDGVVGIPFGINASDIYAEAAGQHRPEGHVEPD